MNLTGVGHNFATPPFAVVRLKILLTYAVAGCILFDGERSPFKFGHGDHKSRRVKTRKEKTMKTEKTMTPVSMPTPATDRFGDLLKTVAKLYPIPGATTLTRKEIDDRQRKYELNLFKLATVSAKSVVKKCIDPTRHNSNSDPDSALLSDSSDSFKHYSDGQKATAVNSGFNPYLKTVFRELKSIENMTDKIMTDPDSDPTLSDVYMTATVQNAVDGLEFISVAQLAILEEIRKQLDREPGDPIDLTRPYQTRRLKKKVYIQDPDSVKGYETVEVVPIVEVYRSIRRYIINERSVKTDPANGYTYIEDLKYKDPGDSDSDSDPTPATVYRRLPKYADLTGSATDSDPGDLLPGQPSNGLTRRPGDGHGDRQAVDDFDRIMEELNLTDRQNQIIILRLRGYGYKAMATYFGVSVDSIRSAVKCIQKKSNKIGLTPVTGRPGYRATPATDPTPVSMPTRKKYFKKATPVTYSKTPTPVSTSPSAFGLIMNNRVVNGVLVGQKIEYTDRYHNSAKIDSWM